MLFIYLYKRLYMVDPVGFSCQGPLFHDEVLLQAHRVHIYCHGSKTCALMTAQFPNLGKSWVVLAINDRNLFFLVGGQS